MTSVAWFGDGPWPVAGYGELVAHRLQSAEREMPFPGRASTGRQADEQAALLRQRLQQSRDIALSLRQKAELRRGMEEHDNNRKGYFSII